MSKFNNHSLVLVLLILLTSCQSHKQEQLKPDSQLTELIGLMSGEFSSLNHSQIDSDYYHISLKMKPVWQGLTDEGHWIYVEQAVGNRIDKPYRQRIYYVTQLNDLTFSSEVYELPNASAVIGAYENPELLEDVSPGDLLIRTGCAVILKRTKPMNYVGSTKDKACLSQLRGATYATSKVVITETGITSWDQGFDAQDNQVWGAEKGPYVFDRK